MRAAISFGVLMLATVQASTTGGLNCHAEDETVTYELRAGITRGLGSPAFNFNGRLTIAKGVPEAFRTTIFEAQDLTMYWLDEMRLMLRVHRERRDPNGSVEIEVMTQVSEEGVYGGQYTITVDGAVPGGEPVKIIGTNTCWVE
ncbi:MAG TPA: hypothetical protein VMF90_07305 [Rhizobiaceae bacterium]|nr:hypothetical protein [Rhizobiaceae bacterium]